MPVTDVEALKRCEDANTDPYGKVCVDVARHAMDILDEREVLDNPHDLISEAQNRLPEAERGITGFQSGCIAEIISQCHSRGDEFRRAWNLCMQIRDEGERANDSGGILNPALLNIAG